MIQHSFPIALITTLSLTFVGCASKNYLDNQYTPYRADLSDQPIEVTHTPPPAAPVQDVNTDPNANGGSGAALPQVVQQVITGTWTFTTPATTTRVERRFPTTDQFSIYNGRPNPTDKPFVVITVSPSGSDDASTTQADPDQYKTSATREYILNGNLAKEYTGLTNTGAAFCELILHRPGTTGDTCHALAIAKTSADRDLALTLLASITWTPTP
jgi:hypothetical protein